MLGRLVKNEILARGINYPLGKISKILQRSDFAIVNLECAITNHSQHWSGYPKAFYFGAPPVAAKILANVGVKLVSLANNHSLDFDFIGLEDTCRYLKQENIQWAGAGENIIAAITPTILPWKSLNFGMVAFCDHQEDFAAEINRPGIAYLDLENEEQVVKQFRESLMQMQKAKVNWPILSLHWGPNMVFRPSQYFIELAHKAVDLGYKIIFGHSAHVFHGIEIYRNCPIIYAAGDLVDDYYVDSIFKNDHQVIFEIEIHEEIVKNIFIYPVIIDFCQVKPANKGQFALIAERMTKFCLDLGTRVHQCGEKSLVINVN